MAEPDDRITDDTDDDDEPTVTPPPAPAATQPPAPVVPKPTPPVVEGERKAPTQAEYDTLARELRIAVKEAKERKARIAEIEAAQATDAERALLEAKAAAAAERDATWRPAIVTARAEAALASAGCTDPEKQELMLRLIDQAAVEVDERGKVVDGLADQIDMIKGKFPDAFAKPRIPSAREVDAGPKTPPAVKQTATEQLAARLNGTNR